MSITVRVEDDTKRKVRALAEATGIKMQAVVEEAVAEYERKVFRERTNTRYSELREEWAGISDERNGESGAFQDAWG